MLLQEAEHFIYKCYQELGLDRGEAEARFVDVKREIEQTGTYEHTFVELEHGARMAWRNSNRCIGRLFWDKLHIRDERHVTGAANIAESLFRHIEMATNGGKIIPTLTVYRHSQPGKPDIRIWNHQLIRYAGYETEHGIVGDPVSLPLTKLCQRLGWEPRRSDFDILPLVIEADGQSPLCFPVPEETVKQVDIVHPDIPGFAALGLRWYAVPILADMMLSIGGIRYTAAPFNGWYMETEIGARNLADPFRYNKLSAVAEMMGLDCSSETTLWKDRALIELNTAVLHSFRRDGVSIVDHHTAAAQFRLFEERERKAGRELTGDWTWLIPPLSPATTHIFHSSYANRVVKPSFFAQEKKYASRPSGSGCPFH